MRRLLTIPVALVFTVFAAGCETGTTTTDPALDPFVGTWNATEATFTSTADPNVTFDRLADGTLTTTITPEGEFTETFTGANGVVETRTGTVAATGDQLTFTAAGEPAQTFQTQWAGQDLALTRADAQWDFGAGLEPATQRMTWRVR